MTSETTFPAVSTELLQAIATALLQLRSISESDAGRPRATGKWSAKQVLGHLIDSAANNHQRFVRARQGPLTFPPYAQDHWVGCQHYQDRAWADLVSLWDAYNRHLVHVIARIAEELRPVPCMVEEATPVR